MTAKKPTKKPVKKPVKKFVASKVKKAVKKAKEVVIEAFTPGVKTTNGVTMTVTGSPEFHAEVVAPSASNVPFIPAFHISHAEAAQAAEHGNEEFQVETKLSVPEIVTRAWDEVRGSDPSFEDCVPPHRDKLNFHAQGILKGDAPMSGDTQIARFEQAVSKLKEKN